MHPNDDDDVDDSGGGGDDGDLPEPGIRIVADIEQKQDNIARATGGYSEMAAGEDNSCCIYSNAPVLTNIFISSGCLCTYLPTNAAVYIYAHVVPFSIYLCIPARTLGSVDTDSNLPGLLFDAS
ncbi:hypothetical protein HN011_006191 [Eciton burchellii]|nr:hypothetical protein HN011_006191 [Eciton burchellii]